MFVTCFSATDHRLNFSPRVIFNRGLRRRNDSNVRLSSSHGDGDVHGIRAVLVLRRDTTDHRAIDNRDARTIRGRVRPVW
jgi:hypothetical protein